MEREFKGYNGDLILTDKAVKIVRKVKGFLLTLKLRGDKTIPYSSIIAVQFKKGGLLSGYLQLSLKGGSDAGGGLNQATKDENTVTFQFDKNKLFAEARDLIEEKILG